MTVNEVLKKVIPTLQAIRVPAYEIPDIGVPIVNAVMDLQKCVEYMDLVEQQEKEKQEQAPEQEENPEAAAEREEGTYE